MVCYGPRVSTIAVACAVAYVLAHRVIGRILHIAGLVLEVTLITCVAAAAAALLAWTVRSVRRRRAAAGACNTCRFRCQQPVLLRTELPTPTARHPQPVTPRGELPIRIARSPRPVTVPAQPPRPTAVRPRPAAVPPRLTVAEPGRAPRRQGARPALTVGPDPPRN